MGWQSIISFRIAEDRPAQGFQKAAAFAGNIGDVAGPVGPACIIGQLYIGGLVQPWANAALTLDRKIQLADHQGIRNKVTRKHLDPAEDDLRTIEVHKVICDTAESPYDWECHKRKDQPCDFGGFFCRWPANSLLFLFDLQVKRSDFFRQNYII